MPRRGRSREGNALKKEREIKEDGRYIIYYEFDDEAEEEEENS